jgi:hypothetical protein
MSNNFIVEQADKPFQQVTITINNQMALDVLTELTGGIYGDPMNDVRDITNDLFHALRGFSSERQEPRFFPKFLETNDYYNQYQ